VDIHERPDTVRGRGVIATPALVRNWPLPVRQIVGDLSDADKVLRALGLDRIQ
jgi:circadian clock protein KaiB